MVPSSRFSACVLLLVVATACGSNHSTLVVERTGPPFAETWPDVEALLASDDPTVTLERLERARLPDTQAHHDALLAALAARDSLTAAQLLLLLEAVSFADARSGTSTITINGETTIRRLHTRGAGRWADVADRLLEEGLPRVLDLDLERFAELAGHAESDALLARIWDRHGAPLDDGSAAAVRTLVHGVGSGDVREALLAGVLAPRGQLDGERGEVAVASLSFDGERTALALALLEASEGVALADVLGWLDTLSFDDSRLELLSAAAPRVGRVSGSDMERMLDELSFDSSRASLLRRFVEVGAVRLTPAELVQRLDAFSFDSSRQEMLALLLPSVEGSLDVDRARDVIGLFSFDGGRLDALARLEPRLVGAEPRERASLVELFSFDSNRERAREILAGAAEPR